MSLARSSPSQPRARARLRLVALVMLLIATLVPLSMLTPTAAPVQASSHREAPLTSEDPLADNTDVYAFVSPDKPDTVTLVANYVPFQLPAGGPNFYRFGDDVLYEIHIDNNGDANNDIVFQFRFHTGLVNPNTFLYNTGPITYDPATKTYPNWNRPQTYDLTVIKNSVTTVLGTGLLSPPNNVGPASTPNYAALVQPAITTGLPNGITSFAGQRDDPFFVDLGRTFDLLGVNPAGGTDFVGGLSVNTLALQVPKAYLQGIVATDPVIGVWATASRMQTTVLNGPPNGGKTPTGNFVQVSRLAMPLVNEAVIPLGMKDRFNATPVGPGNDVQFLNYVTSPELAKLFVALGVDKDTPTTNRTDLVAVFLTGVQGLNQPVTVSPAEMIRLNMSIAPSTNNPNTVNRMGVLGGQLDGFPNGRRLADDVADIELQAVAGILCQPGGPLAGPTPCRTSMVNTALGDGVNANDLPFQTTFPYVANPRPPYGDGSTPPSVPSYSATVTTGGTGTGTVTPGSGTYGGIVNFAAIPAANNIFLGWTVDGSYVGFANPLKLGLSKNRTVRADFAPRPAFTDVPTTNAGYEAISQLAARGFIKGTSPTTFEPSSPVLRAQVAALIGRTLGFTAAPPAGNPFPDRCDPANPSNCIDDELWGYLAALSANGIAKGYTDAATCTAAGTTAPCYLPREPVLGVQAISFITRAFVAKGYWVQETTDVPAIYPNVPASTGARLDLVTFVKNAGDLPSLPSTGAFTGYDQAATRGFFARALYQAYSAYFGINRIPTP